MAKIQANGKDISIVTANNTDLISITDIAKHRDADNPRFIIQNWLRNRNTLEFLGTWEKINNPDFKRIEFEAVKTQAGANSFVMTPKKWIETTNAIGLTSKSGRYGGTYAYSDIAFEFASWISPEFKLYIIQDYQRLKKEEAYKNSLDWQTNRFISKLNYSIHTDAIQQYLITPKLSPQQIEYAYASEADLLNMALYGMTAKQWQEQHPEKQGNIRDHSSIEQLMVLNNLQTINAELLRKKLPSYERLAELNRIALKQQQISLKNNQKTLNELKKL